MPFLDEGPVEGRDVTINSVLKETAESLRKNLSIAAFGKAFGYVLLRDPARKV